MNTLFESPRVCFVEVSEALIPDYLAMVNDLEHVERFLGGRHKPYTEEDEIRWVMKKRADKALVFSMLEKDSGAFIGNIELMDVSDSAAELGIAITAAKQDQGYGTEPILRLLEFAAKELCLRRVKLRVQPGNSRAIRVYEKCGFRQNARTEEDVCMEILL